MKMTRRGFFGLLAAGAIALAASTRLAESGLRIQEGQSLADLIAKVFRERRTEIVDAVMKHNTLLAKLKDGGYSGYEIVNVTRDQVLQAAEYSWSSGPPEIEVA